MPVVNIYQQTMSQYQDITPSNFDDVPDEILLPVQIDILVTLIKKIYQRKIGSSL